MNEFKPYGTPWNATNTMICRQCGALVAGLTEYQELHLMWHSELIDTHNKADTAYRDNNTGA